MDPEDELLAIEKAILAASAGGWLDAIDEIRELAAREDPSVVRRVLALLAPDISAEALAGLTAAFEHGLDDAIRVIGQAPKSLSELAGPDELGALREAIAVEGISRSALDKLADLTETARDALERSKLLIAGGAELDAVLAPLYANRLHVERAIVSAVNEASNDAIAATAIRAGLPLVWVGERDACVHCLAYTGQVSATGTFPEGLTFGGKPLRHTSAVKCPLHPNCRCRLRPLVASEFAEALRREAERSVLRGYSLPSESMASRIAAAERLIERGTDAPASVVAFAQRSIKAGKFPTRRPPVSTARR